MGMIGPNIGITRRRHLLGGVPPVELANISSQSVRLPQNNLYTSAEVVGAAAIHWDTTNTKTFLVPERGDMLYMRVRFPFHSAHVNSNTIHSLLGNSQTTTFCSFIRVASVAKTNQRQITFRFADSADAAAGSISAIPGDQTDFTIGFWVDGTSTSGNLYAAVIDSVTLTQIGSTVTVGHTNFSGTNNFPHQCIGGVVNRDTGVLSGTSCAPIEIDTFGIYANGGNNGTLVDPLDKLIEIASGANPNDVFGSGMHLLCRKWTDPTDLDTPVSGAEYSGPARPDPVFSVVNLNSESLLKGGTIGRQAGSKYLAITPIRENCVFPKEYGASQAVFSISGVTSLADGEVIQMRAFSLYDGTVALDWTDVATVSSNAFTATITSDATKYMGNFEFRSKSSPEDTDLQYVHRRPVGIGRRVVGFGQSQVLQMFYLSGDGSETPVLSTPAVDQVVATFGKNFGTATEGIVSVLLNSKYQKADDGLLAVAKRWGQHTTEPLELICHAQGSTDQVDIADDSNTDRDWTDNEALAAFTGANISIIADQFGTTLARDVSAANAESQIYDEFYLGKTAGASPTISLDSGSYTRNNSILGNSKDDAVFNSNGWDLRILVCPLSRHGEPSNRDPISDVSEDFASLVNFAKYRQLREAQQAAAANNSEIILGLYCNDIYTGDVTGFHQAQDSIYGDVRFGIRFIDAVAAALGIVDLQTPTFNDDMAVDGDTVTITIDMKGMGNLVVGSDLTGVAVPSGYPSISGIEMSDDGGSTWSLTGFTASISNAATGEIQVVNGSGNWTNPRLRFGFGAPFARDEGDHASVHGALYADIGIDTGDDFGKAIAGLQVEAPAGPFAAA